MKSEAYDADGWDVEFDPADNCLVIKTTDYHADPLRLNADMLKRLKVPHLAAPAVVPAPSGSVGIALLRNEKSIAITVPEGWSGPIKLSRKELYRLGRSLGKRQRGRYRHGMLNIS